MAAFTITAANVRYTSTTTSRKATAGETLTPMQPVYKGTDGEFYRAANTGSTAAAATGLCLNYAEDGVQFELVTGGGLALLLQRPYCNSISERPPQSRSLK